MKVIKGLINWLFFCISHLWGVVQLSTMMEDSGSYEDPSTTYATNDRNQNPAQLVPQNNNNNNNNDNRREHSNNNNQQKGKDGSVVSSIMGRTPKLLIIASGTLSDVQPYFAFSKEIRSRGWKVGFITYKGFEQYAKVRTF